MSLVRVLRYITAFSKVIGHIGGIKNLLILMKRIKILLHHHELSQGFMKNYQNPTKSNRCRPGNLPTAILFIPIIIALFISGCEKPKETAAASLPVVEVV